MHTAVTTLTWEEKRHNLVGIELQTSKKKAQEFPYTHSSFQGCQDLGLAMAALFSVNCCDISKALQQDNNWTGTGWHVMRNQRGLKWNGMQGPEMYTYWLVGTNYQQKEEHGSAM